MKEREEAKKAKEDKEKREKERIFEEEARKRKEKMTKSSRLGLRRGTLLRTRLRLARSLLTPRV